MKNQVKFTVDEEIYSLIPKDIREFITIEVIEPKDFDYSKNEEWLEQKSKANKEYKKLKDLEYKIRHEKENI